MFLIFLFCVLNISGFIYHCDKQLKTQIYAVLEGTRPNEWLHTMVHNKRDANYFHVGGYSMVL